MLVGTMSSDCTRRQCLGLLGLALLTRPSPAATSSALAVLHEGGSRWSRFEGQGLSMRRERDLPLSMAAWLAQGLAAGDDGTLLAIDPVNGGVHARRRIGTARPRAARSRDGRWYAVLPADAHEWLLLDAGLRTVKRWPLPSPATWLTDAPHRQAFLLGLADPAQLWVLSYDERAEDFYEGLVHDYRMGEGVPQRGFHNVRRMALPAPLMDPSLDAESTELAGQAMVFNLDVRKVVARPAALRPPGAGTAALASGGSRLLVPVRGARGVEVFTTGDWRHLGTIATDAAVARMLPLGGRLLALPEPAAGARQLATLDARTLQPLPPWPLPGPFVDAAPASDGRALWLQLGGEAEGVACLDSADGRVTARRGLAGVRALQALDG